MTSDRRLELVDGTDDDDARAGVRRFQSTAVAPAQLAGVFPSTGQLAEPRRPGRYQAFKPCENADCRHMLTQHDWNSCGDWPCQAPNCSCLDFLRD